MTDYDFPHRTETTWYYLIQRHDGKTLGIYDSRHEAVGRTGVYHDCSTFTIIPTPAAATLFVDTKIPDHENNVAGHNRYND